MTTKPVIAAEVPTLDDDPFGREILTDPYPFHRVLRDLAPIVLLWRYGVYAMGRFDEVLASLLDWQTFVSSRGAGLSDFAKEKPWRPPSLPASPESWPKARTGFAKSSRKVPSASRVSFFQ